MYASRRAPLRNATPTPAEKLVGPPTAPRAQEEDGYKQFAAELEAMRAAIARSKQALAALARNDAGEMPLPRAAKELSAAISGMEGATDKILKAAESIDETSRTLTAALKNDYKRGLAHDIQDHVLRLYEACNFQDLTGQRISKAIDTLRLVETQLSRVSEIWGGIEEATKRAKPTGAGLLNGPKLEGDIGHADQGEIDLMFA
jgi:chemotaxis protein CheZ